MPYRYVVSVDMASLRCEDFGEGWRVKFTIIIPYPVDASIARLETPILARNYIADRELFFGFLNEQT